MLHLACHGLNQGFRKGQACRGSATAVILARICLSLSVQFPQFVKIPVWERLLITTGTARKKERITGVARGQGGVIRKVGDEVEKHLWAGEIYTKKAGFRWMCPAADSKLVKTASPRPLETACFGPLVNRCRSGTVIGKDVGRWLEHFFGMAHLKHLESRDDGNHKQNQKNTDGDGNYDFIHNMMDHPVEAGVQVGVFQTEASSPQQNQRSTSPRLALD